MSTRLLAVVPGRGATFARRLALLEARGERSSADVERRVRAIIETVRRRGDRALIAYTQRFDGVRLSARTIEVPRRAMVRAEAELPGAVRRALRLAARRIRTFHLRQRQASWSFRDAAGARLGQQVTPLDRVGVYIPGGTAAYPSSVLMNVIPARVAGVGEVIGVTPAGRNGVPPAVLAAAHIAGIDRLFRIGGAQAIAALAYGTRLVPRVDKICGPGNVYVATAKRLVFGAVDIDMIAGPSEVLIVADAHATPAFVAADLLSQAEHDPLAASILVTPSAALAAKVEVELAAQLARLPRRAIARRALQRYGTAFVTPRSRRRSRSPTASRPSISSSRCGDRSAGSARSVTPARSFSASTRPSRSATISPGRTTCCRPAAARASPRRSASTTSSSARA